jgi:hypothetical protein
MVVASCLFLKKYQERKITIPPAVRRMVVAETLFIPAQGNAGNYSLTSF